MIKKSKLLLFKIYKLINKTHFKYVNILFLDLSSMSNKKREINAPLIVVSNRLPFVLAKNAEGQLIRKQRYK